MTKILVTAFQPKWFKKFGMPNFGHSKFLADLKNQPIGSSCVTHILPFCGYFKGQEQTVFNYDQ